MVKENTSIRLKKLMNDRNIRQIDILDLCAPYCKKYDVKMNKSDISQYVSGKVEPNQHKLAILGMALNVNEAWLMGYDVPMQRKLETTDFDKITSSQHTYINALMKRAENGEKLSKEELKDLTNHVQSSLGKFKNIVNIIGTNFENNIKKMEDETSTIAAHFDGDKYTDDELEEIKNFAAFVKNKRNK